MCELLALSSRTATTLTLSLETFARHGAPSGRNVDGWGLVIYDDGDARQFREPAPAGNSAWLRFIERNRLPSCLVLSHIRRATQGAVTLRNTQPFIRELGGRIHAFAHNGSLAGIESESARGARRFRPLGETDSEAAFCVLLERMAPLWDAGAVPALADRLAVVRQFATALRDHGPANFLYADGDTLFAHGHRRIQADGRIAPPGLFRLTRSCAVDRDALQAAGVTLGAWSPPQAVTVVASVPLTAEAWIPLAEGEVVAVAAGAVVATGDDRTQPE